MNLILGRAPERLAAGSAKQQLIQKPGEKEVQPARGSSKDYNWGVRDRSSASEIYV